MCRNIKPLFNFDPPATDDEIHSAALQFTRKISGFAKPSEVNKAVFEKAVAEFSLVSRSLLDSLVTQSAPRNREIEAARAQAKSRKRFGV